MVLLQMNWRSISMAAALLTESLSCVTGSLVIPRGGFNHVPMNLECNCIHCYLIVVFVFPPCFLTLALLTLNFPIETLWQVPLDYMRLCSEEESLRWADSMSSSANSYWFLLQDMFKGSFALSSCNDALFDDSLLHPLLNWKNCNLGPCSVDWLPQQKWIKVRTCVRHS